MRLLPICAYYLETKKRVSDAIYLATCGKLSGSDGFKILVFWFLARVDKLVFNFLHIFLQIS